MKRRHNAKFWLLLAALGLVGGACLVGFQYSQLNGDKERVAKLQAQTQDESAVQAALTRSQQDLEDSKAQLTHLEQGIPSTAYVPTMLQELAKTGNDCGIAVTGVRPVPRTAASTAAAASANGTTSVSKPAYDELDIEVKGRGTYGAAQKFIQALQKFPKIVGARTVEVIPCLEPNDADKGLLDITIGLRAYLFKDADKKGDVQANNSANSKGKEASA